MFNHLSLPSYVSMARAKLHSSAAHGAKDDIGLCRWVLLKNSLTNAMGRSTDPVSHKPSVVSPPSTEDIVIQHDSSNDDEADVFLFPDGDVFAESFGVEAEHADINNTHNDHDAEGSEAQWFDSLWESLIEDNDDNLHISPDPEDEEEESDLMSLLDLPSDSSLTSSVTSPEMIHLPPSPPLIAVSFTPHSDPYNLLTYSDTSVTDDLDPLAPPDSTEDSSSDTDSEPPHTPFTRSTSSLPGSLLSGPPVIRILDRDVDDFGLRYPFDQHFSMDPPQEFEQAC